MAGRRARGGGAAGGAGHLRGHRARSHIDLSLGLTSPGQQLAFAITLALLLFLTLPLLTRASVAVQAGLGQALLSDVSTLLRRIRGLEQERDTARAQAVAAVTAEAAALRRLERDIHGGPRGRPSRLSSMPTRSTTSRTRPSRRPRTSWSPRR
ncbi:MAG TPA: hypothetical protein VMF87_25520 [Streptosporangiaceae bacterium]|nr:hypothetical protein [Streptosporangiaceae bacterium]